MEIINKIHPHLLLALIGIFAVLINASLIAIILVRTKPQSDFSELTKRIKTWWLMAAVFTFAMVLSKTISLVFFALISYLALKEYFSLIPTRRADRVTSSKRKKRHCINSQANQKQLFYRGCFRGCRRSPISGSIFRKGHF